LHSWAKRPARQPAVHALAGACLGQSNSAEEKAMTPRTAKILMVETGDAKAGQPCGGKIGADMLGEIATNDVYNRNDQQHARHIAEHKKPE
jgi:hypothetical protein